MLTCTITNLSSEVEIGMGTDFPLPAPFDWFTIAVSDDKAVICRVQDLQADFGRLSGFTVADELQRMVQAGVCSVGFANLAATMANDVGGDAVSNES